MYKVVYTESAIKALSKLDRQTLRVIKNWVTKHLIDCDDPRASGKQLKGNLAGIWRYRVGKYRIFATIDDFNVTIEIFDVGHRREVYK